MKRTANAARIGAAAGLVLMFFGCVSTEDLVRVAMNQMEQPEVRIISVELTEISFRAAEIEFEIGIYNPNPRGVRLERVDYAVLIEGSRVIAGTIDEPIALEAEASVVVRVPTAIIYSDIREVVSTVRDDPEAGYRMEATVSFDLPYLGPVDVPVAHEGSLPVVTLPEVKFSGLSLERASLQGVDLVLSVRVQHRNAFAITLESVAYQLDVNDRRWISGSVERPLIVDPNEATVFDLPLRVSAGTLGPAIGEIMTGRTGLDFVASGQARLAADLPGLDERLELPLALSGRLQL